MVTQLSSSLCKKGFRCHQLMRMNWQIPQRAWRIGRRSRTTFLLSCHHSSKWMWNRYSFRRFKSTRGNSTTKQTWLLRMQEAETPVRRGKTECKPLRYQVYAKIATQRLWEAEGLPMLMFSPSISNTWRINKKSARKSMDKHLIHYTETKAEKAIRTCWTLNYPK